MINLTLLAIIILPLLAANIIGPLLHFDKLNKELFFSKLVTPIYLIQTLGSIYLLFCSLDGPIEIHQQIIHFQDYHYDLDFLIAPYLCILSFAISVMFLVIHAVSKRYLHAEEEQGKFYILKLVFNFALISFIFATNVNFLLFGWEIVGFTSVLLISYFYRRNQAVENSQFAFAIYRLCDATFLIFCIMMAIHYQTLDIMSVEVSGTNRAIFAALIFFTIMGKSGVYPLSSWLPLALEGPTPSSGLYYTAMSTHLGAILLLKTETIWRGDGIEFYLLVIFSIILIISTLINSLSAKAQPSIKGAIVYATMANVSIILLEILWGFRALAIVHLCFHMFYRFTQLLLSPSVIDKHLKAESMKGSDIVGSTESFFLIKNKIPSSLYLRALNGFESEKIMKHFFDKIQKPFHFVTSLESKIFKSIYKDSEDSK